MLFTTINYEQARVLLEEYYKDIYDDYKVSLKCFCGKKRVNSGGWDDYSYDVSVVQAKLILQKGIEGLGEHMTFEKTIDSTEVHKILQAKLSEKLESSGIRCENLNVFKDSIQVFVREVDKGKKLLKGVVS